MIKRISSSLILIVLFSINTLAQTSLRSDVKFLGEPSAHSNGIIFTYDTDLWIVSKEGGEAIRITGMEGEESNPVFSPDGNWIAFTSNQYGNNDVYIMSTQDRKITQLTFHQANDQVESWSWDSKKIYFSSNRYNRITTFEISPEGGTPTRLFEHYHNTVHNLSEHPTSGDFYFNESWESFIFPQRKRYVGSFNPDIKSYNPKTDTYTEHTSWEGKDFSPTIDQNGKVYFISDEANNEYNLYTLENGQKKQLTRFNTSIYNPSVSPDGSVVVFERDYVLYKYDIASNRATKIDVTITKNNTLTKSQSFDVKDNISAFDVSPDKKKMAFISRGELFVSDAEGKFVRQIETNSMGRVLEVKWLADNKTLIFNQTVDGYQNWFTIAADGNGTEKQHTSDKRNNRDLALNHDRTAGVYLSGRDQLRHIDLDNFKSKTLVENEFWGFQNVAPMFSPNGEYVLFSAKHDFELDIYVHHLDSERTMNLTNTGVDENGAFWSPDGKYIYYTGSRSVPSYPRGAGETDLFRIPLDYYDDPYKSDLFDELFAEKEENEDSKDGKEEEKLTIEINTTNLMQRVERVGEGFGNQFSPFVTQKDDKSMVLYGSNHNEGDFTLSVTTFEPFERPKTQSFEGTGFVSGIIEVDGQLYGLIRGAINKLDPSSAKANKIDVSHSFERNLQDEFYQMFDELWANIEENFYNETFHGIDWKKIKDRYKKYLPYVDSRADLRRMNNDMLGELNSSHMGFNTSGNEENQYYSTVSMATGIIWEKDNPYQVSEIIETGPVHISGNKINTGDELIAVNGKDVDATMNREMYFSVPSMPEEVTLTFKQGSSNIDIKIHPTSYFSDRNDLYDEWVSGNQKMVDEKTDKKVAYVHMKNMGGGELNNFLIEMTSEAYNRDALIFDLRYNTGGNVHDDVLRFLSQRQYANWAYRGGELAPQSNFAPADKPVILLINEQSLSDAEVTAEGFKQLGLGTVMGTETYRWIIFTSGKGLVDGSFYRLPSWGLYTLDGENIEQTGVAPDIEIHNTFKDRVNGNDPQLEKAIQEILDQLKND
ncbi:peptidase S41 [Balneola sp. EhC07]|uniref:S41 family peptidase n=1 Tax=Balneola sp. EhC07 TaxID=1849360 RepID=UPI0007F4FFA8|nr:S41 family peptidase [Balneola sp. EhC07]OAN60483.1 peptidase S41 [Balneola sp. EhC07]